MDFDYSCSFFDLYNLHSVQNQQSLLPRFFLPQDWKDNGVKEIAGRNPCVPKSEETEAS